jgi:hypothetical protein
MMLVAALATPIAAAQAPTTAPISNGSMEMIAGTAILVTGVAVALYGFGHPTAPPPDPVHDPSSFPHRTGVGLTGLGLMGAGCAIAWHGWHRSTPSIELGPHRAVAHYRIRF